MKMEAMSTNVDLSLFPLFSLQPKSSKTHHRPPLLSRSHRPKLKIITHKWNKFRLRSCKMETQSSVWLDIEEPKRSSAELIARGFVGFATTAAAVVSLTCSSPAFGEALIVAFPVS